MFDWRNLISQKEVIIYSVSLTITVTVVALIVLVLAWRKNKLNWRNMASLVPIKHSAVCRSMPSLDMDVLNVEANLYTPRVADKMTLLDVSDKFVVPKSRSGSFSMFQRFDKNMINKELYNASNRDVIPTEEQILGQCGSLQMAVSYDPTINILRIKLIQASNLTSKTDTSPSPYFKISLIPPASCEQPQCYQTKTYAYQRSPDLSEEFHFEVRDGSLDQHKLEISVYDHDQYYVDECIGRCTLSVGRIELSEDPSVKTVFWAEIMSTNGEMANSAGDLLLSISYLSKAQRLIATVIKARNLPSNEDHPNETLTLFRSPRLQKVSKELVAQLSKNSDKPVKLPISDNNSDIDKKKLVKRKKLRKALKIVLPHVGLNILLILYMSAGALILMFIEKDHELYKRHEKLTNVTKIYKSIFTLTNRYCESKSTSNSIVENVSSISEQMFKDDLESLLIDLSKVHEFDDRFADEDQLWTNDETQIRSRWTFQAALLYVLTVLCTTGYDHISPATDAGRIFAVCFGLLGIPLMFIAAADIGKFLSEMVSKAYSKFLTLGRYVKRKLAKLAQMRRKWRNEDSNSGRMPLSEEPAACPTKKMSLMSENDSLFNVSPVASETRLELPIISYFGLVLGYCSIGSLLFNSFERGSVWSFIHGFFFSFNTITTMGLGNVMVSNNFYLCLIVVYCIVGLAVITMCVDLASSHLKMLFTKLHYFGRKFRGARDTFLMAMSDDIKEALRLLAALKRARPADRSGRITLEDIKTFLEIELQQKTQPFIPLAIEHLRYVDEEEIESLRTPIIGPEGSALLCCALGAHQIPYFLCSDGLLARTSTQAARKQKPEVGATNHSLNILSV